ncbi:EamA family transporter [Caulobacter sp. CCUG 60055]|uniref:DMT family transporter n=1 Tax=Caulobacter sp. CCUG 60055 TaxID=2100090 RepID=UPI001FA702B8|nr:DMT family transporter [Caulobacter sp. CCUG 60055]MCI3180540.1 EamA family transporter [Caulobacter sp. CCUG 60055]
MTDTHRYRLGAACGVVAGAFWGAVFLAPKLLAGFSPLQMTAGRYLAYGLASAVLIAPAWRSVAGRVTRADWLALTWLSLAGNIVYYLFLAASVQIAGVAPASLIVGLLPVTVTLIGSRHDGAVPLRKLAAPLVLIGLGVLCINLAVFTGGGGGASLVKLAFGVACAFGALATWTVYAVGNARHLARHPHFTNGEWSLLTGLVTGGLSAVIAVPAFMTGFAAHLPADWLRFAGVSFAVAIGASIIGNGLWNAASRLLPLTLSGQLIVFETVFALFYGFLYERRVPGALEAAAIALLLAGVFWSVRLHRDRPPEHAA